MPINLSFSMLIELIVIVEVLINIKIGYSKGFIKTVIPVVSFIISFIFVKVLIRPVTQIIAPLLGKGIVNLSETLPLIKLCGGTEIIEYASSSINNMLAYWIAYTISFSIIFAITKCLLYKLNFISNYPILKSFNQMLGLAIGVAKSIAQIWLSYLTLSILASSGLSYINSFSNLLNQSMIYKYINTYNPLIDLI